MKSPKESFVDISDRMARYSAQKEQEVEDMFCKKNIRTSSNAADRELKSEIETRRAKF